jgi:hypothetical protein
MNNIFIETKLIKNGSIIMLTKKDFMELLHNFQNILKKEKCQNKELIIKKFGSNKFLIILDLILMELVKILKKL